MVGGLAFSQIATPYVTPVVCTYFDEATAWMLLSLPVALAGVAAAFLLAKASFSREAAVGVILVEGLAVHQAILLVHGALLRRRAKGRKLVPLTAQQVVGAARDRSGMIVLITATTMASLVPLAVGDATDTLFGSIALATAGGTIFGTIGAMWVLPLMLMPLRRPKFRFRLPKFWWPKLRLRFWRTAS